MNVRQASFWATRVVLAGLAFYLIGSLFLPGKGSPSPVKYAINVLTGKPLRHQPEIARAVLVSRDLQLVLCDSDDHKPQLLVARSVIDGEEVFHTLLPVIFFGLDSLQEYCGIFVIQDPFHETSFIVDRNGKIWHQFDSGTLECKQADENRVFVTGNEVACLSAKGESLWTFKFGPGMFGPGGGAIELPDKSLIAYVYGDIYDSGVSLMRIDPSAGKLMWRAYCEALGVSHNKYSHKASVTIQNQTVQVDSVGSHGEFVATLDLDTGKQLSRHLIPSK